MKYGCHERGRGFCEGRVMKRASMKGGSMKSGAMK